MPLDRCPWYIGGPVLGLVIIGLRATVNKPLGALGGYIDVTEHVTRLSRLGFSAFLLAGIVIGAGLFALITGSSSPSPSYSGLLPADPFLQLGILFLAGVAMGVGARTAGGCTSGHGLTGVSLGSPASIVSAMTFFSTAVALANVWAWLTAIAAIGVRVLKLRGVRCIVTGEPVDWSVEQPRTRHVAGSVLFGIGWTVAGTCPGPVAAMIGEGRLVGVPVAVGLLAGVTVQRMLATKNNIDAQIPAPATAGL
jgi:uncharacterized membrane protein YedE/YeeE